jgi:hypothetical protein
LEKPQYNNTVIKKLPYKIRVAYSLAELSLETEKLETFVNFSNPSAAVGSMNKLYFFRLFYFKLLN